MPPKKTRNRATLKNQTLFSMDVEAHSDNGFEQKDQEETVPKDNPKMEFDYHFSKPETHPFDEIEWQIREAIISNDKGETVFKQSDVEVPDFWSQLAINVVVSKYFHGPLGSNKRERSVKQLIDRVSRTISEWGKKDNYFAGEKDVEVFYKELTYLLANQYVSFNSPVWFNVGIEDKPQCSACFINSVQDNMQSILNLAKIEGMLFKYGSGTGTNLSSLRSSKENISGGGQASGPVSFMKGFDAFAGVIKSGGKTRRAAKMVILNADHPDIEEFIISKAHEEKKAWALIDAGYEGSINGEAYGSIFFQNANHSVRVSDEFMERAEDDLEWVTREVVTSKPVDRYRAKDLLRKIAEGTYICGDPGMQFDTTINDWHTCPNSARINASNPCSEYMFIDDTACNLASLNLMKFLNAEGEFDTEAFKKAVRTTITAMEIIVDNSSYPRKEISENSHIFRTLGLGYANLGALLMSQGLPYDSDEGREFAGVITSVMCGQAYLTSSELATVMGPFEEYEKNAEPMLRVIQKHRSAAYNLKKEIIPDYLFEESCKIWDAAYQSGKENGYRNAQVTVLAPTGTIAFMMDCDTTGVEPDIALVKIKNLVGGGVLRIVNQTVQNSLEKLQYDESSISEIINYINENYTIEGAPRLKEEHLPVFDCAFKPLNGERSIHYMGHVKMLAATQPFISGAISKTVNVPEEITVEDIMDIYLNAWKMRVKAIAIYRDNSKRTQPLSTAVEKTVKEYGRPYRRRLPDEREAITHKFSVGGHEGYITVGKYEDGSPGEIFIVMAKEGSVVSGLMDSFATAISMALQYGVPLKVLCNKFTHTRFEPSGLTNNPHIPMAKSITDYIFRWLATKFLSKEEQLKYMSPDLVEENNFTSNKDATKSKTKTTQNLTKEVENPATVSDEDGRRSSIRKHEQIVFEQTADAPNCPDCGSIMTRSGSCYRCIICGTTSGCS
jgi:ribonucleoside-diphosphate reductase alpha chain